MILQQGGTGYLGEEKYIKRSTQETRPPIKNFFSGIFGKESPKPSAKQTTEPVRKTMALRPVSYVENPNASPVKPQVSDEAKVSVRTNVTSYESKLPASPTESNGISKLNPVPRSGSFKTNSIPISPTITEQDDIETKFESDSSSQKYSSVPLTADTAIPADLPSPTDAVIVDTPTKDYSTFFPAKETEPTTETQSQTPASPAVPEDYSFPPAVNPNSWIIQSSRNPPRLYTTSSKSSPIKPIHVVADSVRPSTVKSLLKLFSGGGKTSTPITFLKPKSVLSQKYYPKPLQESVPEPINRGSYGSNQSGSEKMSLQATEKKSSPRTSVGNKSVLSRYTPNSNAAALEPKTPYTRPVSSIRNRLSWIRPVPTD
jgi:hypothetical protein